MILRLKWGDKERSRSGDLSLTPQVCSCQRKPLLAATWSSRRPSTAADYICVVRESSRMQFRRAHANNELAIPQSARPFIRKEGALE